MRSIKVIRRKREITLIFLMILLITSLHYLASTHAIEIHAFYRRLYYLPIIYASFKFGLTGGIATALVSSFFYTPHLILYVGHMPTQLAENFYEVILFNVIGWATGVLSENEKRLEEQVRRSEKLSALGILITGLAHEIRNPLGTISATAQLLKDDNDLACIQEGLEVIREETIRLNKILTELIDFAKPTPSEGTVINLNEAIKDTTLLFKKVIEEQGVNLNLELENSPLLVYLDSQKFKQLLVNLILNSLQAMPQGGNLKIVTWKKENKVSFRLKDTGTGIPEDILPQIFNPFFTTKETGTGLGLSIVHRIVEDYQGRIEVRSFANRGAEFTISFPGKED